MTQERLLFSWDDFEKFLPSTIRALHGDENFTDVTLVTEDGSQLKVHKVIISSCSKLFRDILINNPHPHPLIYLADIRLKELEKLIQFMYLGQCEAKQSELQTFLSAAKRLKIQGLHLLDNVPNTSTEEKFENNDVIAKEEKCFDFEEGECADKILQKLKLPVTENETSPVENTSIVHKGEEVQNRTNNSEDHSDEEGYIGEVEQKHPPSAIARVEEKMKAKDFQARLLKDPTRYFKKVPNNYIGRWRALKRNGISGKKLRKLDDKAIVGRKRGQLGLFYPVEDLEKLEEKFLPSDLIREKKIFHSLSRPQRMACNFPSNFRSQAIVGKQGLVPGKRSHFYTRELVQRNWPYLLETWLREEEELSDEV